MASDSSSSYQAPYAESTASRSSPPPEIIEPSDNNPEVFTPQHSVPNSEPFTFFTANTHPTQPPDEPPRASTPMDASTSSSLTNPSAPSSVYGQYVLWEELASGIPSASLPNEDVWLFRRPGEIFEDLRISAQHEIRRSGINFRNAEKRAEEVRSNGGNGSDGLGVELARYRGNGYRSRYDDESEDRGCHHRLPDRGVVSTPPGDHGRNNRSRDRSPVRDKTNGCNTDHDRELVPSPYSNSSDRKKRVEESRRHILSEELQNIIRDTSAEKLQVTIANQEKQIQNNNDNLKLLGDLKELNARIENTKILQVQLDQNTKNRKETLQNINMEIAAKLAEKRLVELDLEKQESRVLIKHQLYDHHCMMIKSLDGEIQTKQQTLNQLNLAEDQALLKHSQEKTRTEEKNTELEEIVCEKTAIKKKLLDEIKAAQTEIIEMKEYLNEMDEKVKSNAQELNRQAERHENCEELLTELRNVFDEEAENYLAKLKMQEKEIEDKELQISSRITSLKHLDDEIVKSELVVQNLKEKIHENERIARQLLNSIREKKSEIGLQNAAIKRKNSRLDEHEKVVEKQIKADAKKPMVEKVASLGKGTSNTLSSAFSRNNNSNRVVWVDDHPVLNTTPIANLPLPIMRICTEGSGNNPFELGGGGKFTTPSSTGSRFFKTNTSPINSTAATGGNTPAMCNSPAGTHPTSLSGTEFIKYSKGSSAECFNGNKCNGPFNASGNVAESSVKDSKNYGKDSGKGIKHSFSGMSLNPFSRRK